MSRCDEYRIAGTVIAAVGGEAWDATCDLGLLRPTLRPNMLSLRLLGLAAGCYEYKVSVNASWALSYGVDGRYDPGCPNLVLTLSSKSDVTFFFDVLSHRVETDVLPVNVTPRRTPPHSAQPSRIASVEKRQGILRRASDFSSSPRRQITDQHLLVARMAAERGQEWSSKVDERAVIAHEIADHLWLSCKLYAVHQAVCLEAPDSDDEDAYEMPNTPAMFEEMPLREVYDVNSPLTQRQQNRSDTPIATITIEPAIQKMEAETVVVPKKEVSLCQGILETVKLVIRPICGDIFGAPMTYAV